MCNGQLRQGLESPWTWWNIPSIFWKLRVKWSFKCFSINLFWCDELNTYCCAISHKSHPFSHGPSILSLVSNWGMQCLSPHFAIWPLIQWCDLFYSWEYRLEANCLMLKAFGNILFLPLSILLLLWAWTKLNRPKL
jgi:hypothetical protein